jgi:hypothetical protein
VFTFEYATGRLTRAEKLRRPMIPERVPRSPDGAKAINWDDGQLTLHRDGSKPEVLGRGFKIGEPPEVRPESLFSCFPVLWLDDDRFLTQRANGKLVTVTTSGAVAEAVTITGVPRRVAPELTRDASGAIIYSANRRHYRIDLDRKTAVRSNWRSLAHDFEIAWECDKEGRSKFRHDGKEIGRFNCWPEGVKAAPGHLAFQAGKSGEYKIGVWSAATGNWTMLDYPLAGVLGWLK